MSLIAYGTHALICKLQMEIILESASVRSEMKVVLQCENDVQVDALTVVDFTMLNVVCHVIVIIVLRFIVGY